MRPRRRGENKQADTATSAEAGPGADGSSPPLHGHRPSAEKDSGFEMGPVLGSLFSTVSEVCIYWTAAWKKLAYLTDISSPLSIAGPQAGPPRPGFRSSVKEGTWQDAKVTSVLPGPHFLPPHVASGPHSGTVGSGGRGVGCRVAEGSLTAPSHS